MEHQKDNEEFSSKRGFASMDEQRRREIASQGGRAAHEKGTAHQFDSNEARAAGRKGGQARAQNQSNTESNSKLDSIESEEVETEEKF